MPRRRGRARYPPRPTKVRKWVSYGILVLVFFIWLFWPASKNTHVRPQSTKNPNTTSSTGESRRSRILLARRRFLENGTVLDEYGNLTEVMSIANISSLLHMELWRTPGTKVVEGIQVFLRDHYVYDIDEDDDIVHRIWPNITRRTAQDTMRRYVDEFSHVHDNSSKNCDIDASFAIADGMILANNILNAVLLARGVRTATDYPQRYQNAIAKGLLQSGPGGLYRLNRTTHIDLEAKYFGNLTDDNRRHVTEVFQAVKNTFHSVNWICQTSSDSHCLDGDWAYVPSETPDMEVFICPRLVNKGASYYRTWEEEGEGTHRFDDNCRAFVILHEMIHLVSKQTLNETLLPHFIPDQKSSSVTFQDSPGDFCYEYPESKAGYCSKIYGPKRSQKLAATQPSLAQSNADNYVFYAVDLTLWALFGEGKVTDSTEDSLKAAYMDLDSWSKKEGKKLDWAIKTEVRRRREKKAAEEWREKQGRGGS